MILQRIRIIVGDAGFEPGAVCRANLITNLLVAFNLGHVQICLEINWQV